MKNKYTTWITLQIDLDSEDQETARQDAYDLKSNFRAEGYLIPHVQLLEFKEERDHPPKLINI